MALTSLQSLLAAGGRIDGGAGVDTLKLAAGTQLSLPTLTDTQTVSPIQEVEIFEMQGNSKLEVNANNVLSLGSTNLAGFNFASTTGGSGSTASTGKVQMVVKGTASDQIVMTGLATDGLGSNTGTLVGAWLDKGTVSIGGVSYRVYDHSTTQAQLLVNVNATVDSPTISITSMTKDSGATADLTKDWTTADASAGRLLSGAIEKPLAAGDVVKVFANGVEIGNAQVSGTQWAITDPAGYKANWVYSAKVVTAAGVEGPAASQVVTLDTTVPVAPVISVIGTDAGYSSVVDHNGTTGDNTLVVGGTGTPGTLITLYDNTTGNIVKSGVPVAANGTWSADLTGTLLPNGVHNFYATQTSSTGMVSALSNQYTATVQVDLVINGSFENPAPATGSYGATYSGTQVPGSTIIGSMDVTRENWTFGALGTTINTPWGINFMDTAGLSAASMYQDVTGLIVGQTYTFSFAYARFFNQGDTLNYTLTGATSLSETYTPTAQSWTTVTKTFVATSSTVRMQFTSTNGDGVADQGPLVDNVTLVRNGSDYVAPNGTLTAGAALSTQTATANADTLSYTNGSVSSLGGDDVVSVPTSVQSLLAAGGSINTGAGVDTLKLATGTRLDLTALTNTQTVSPLQEVEVFQMQGRSSLTFNANDVLSLGTTNLTGFNFASTTGGTSTSSSGKVQMVIKATSTDQVNMEALATDGLGSNTGTLGGTWDAKGQVTIGGVTYNVYDHSTTLAQVLVNIDPSVQQTAITFSSMSKDSGYLGSNNDWLTSDGSAGRVLSGFLDQPLKSGEVVKVFSNGTLIGNAVVSGTQWEITDPNAYTANWKYTAQVVPSTGTPGPVASQIVTTDFVEAAPVITSVYSPAGVPFTSSSALAGLTTTNLMPFGSDGYSTTNWTAAASDNVLPRNVSNNSSNLTTGPFTATNGAGVISLESDKDGSLYDSQNPTGLGSMIYMAAAQPVTLLQGQNYRFAFDAAYQSANTGSANMKWVLVDQNNVFVKEISPWYTSGGSEAVSGAVALSGTAWTNFDMTFQSDLPTGSYRLATAWDVASGGLSRDIVLDRVYLGWASDATGAGSVGAVTGTGMPGNIVYLYDNSGDNLVGSSTVQADGTWAVVPSVTYSGSNTYSAKQLDPSGNLSTLSNTLTVNATGTNMLVNGSFDQGNSGFASSASNGGVVSSSYNGAFNGYEVLSTITLAPLNNPLPTPSSLLNQTTAASNLTWSKNFNGTSVQANIPSMNGNPNGAMSGSYLTGSFNTGGTIWDQQVDVVAGQTYRTQLGTTNVSTTNLSSGGTASSPFTGTQSGLTASSLSFQGMPQDKYFIDNMQFTISGIAESAEIASGGVTRYTTGTVNGTLAAPLQAGQYLQVFSNGVSLGSATVNGTSWTFNDAIAATGENYTAKVMNIDGTAVTSSNTYAVNQVASTTPKLTISDDVSGSAATGVSVNYTFAFDQAVTGFDASDIVVTNGGVRGPLIQLDSKTWVMSVNAPDSGAGSTTVSVADGSFTASISGGSGVGHSDTQAYDVSLTKFVMNQYASTGTPAALTTGAANDQISAVGNNGDEIINLGGGNDFLEMFASNVTRLALATGNASFDGGTGVDRLSLWGTGVTLDLTNLNVGNNLKNFESIDITGTGNNTVKLSLSNVLQLPNATDVASTPVNEASMLVINGNAGDTVQLAGGINWTAVTSGVTGATLSATYGSGYNFIAADKYTQLSYNGGTLFIDEAMTRTNV